MYLQSYVQCLCVLHKRKSIRFQVNTNHSLRNFFVYQLSRKWTVVGRRRILKSALKVYFKVTKRFSLFCYSLIQSATIITINQLNQSFVILAECSRDCKATISSLICWDISEVEMYSPQQYMISTHRQTKLDTFFIFLCATKWMTLHDQQMTLKRFIVIKAVD